MSISLTDKIVMITGASSGIGLACAEQFAQAGAKLLLCARRTEKLVELAEKLEQRFQVATYAASLDVRDEQQIAKLMQSLPTDWQSIDILVNNAGLAKGLDKIQEGRLQDWQQMIDTNVTGVLLMSKAVLPAMLERQSGHIINIGSVSGYEVYSGGVVYCATKFALRAISDGLKMDVHGSPLRVSAVMPGMVETEFSRVRFSGDEQRARAVYQNTQPLLAEDVADAVLYCATRPAHVDVREIKIYPTDQTATHLLRRDSHE